MLNRDIQTALAQRYVGNQVAARARKAFDRTTVEGFQQAFREERKAPAAAIYVDIASFSRKVDGWDAVAVRKYLDDYYKVVLPRIFNHGGMIERVAADGVIAIFSTLFEQKVLAQVEDNAYEAAQESVRALQNTDMAAKGAVSTGDLLFCRTGIAEIYQEYTVIGTPLTELHRLEDAAGVNEVWLREDTALGKRVQKKLLPPNSGDYFAWIVGSRSVKLRGVDGGQLVPVLVAKCQPE